MKLAGKFLGLGLLSRFEWSPANSNVDIFTILEEQLAQFSVTWLPNRFPCRFGYVRSREENSEDHLVPWGRGA